MTTVLLLLIRYDDYCAAMTNPVVTTSVSLWLLCSYDCYAVMTKLSHDYYAAMTNMLSWLLCCYDQYRCYGQYIIMTNMLLRPSRPSHDSSCRRRTACCTTTTCPRSRPCTGSGTAASPGTTSSPLASGTPCRPACIFLKKQHITGRWWRRIFAASDDLEGLPIRFWERRRPPRCWPLEKKNIWADCTPRRGGGLAVHGALYGVY